MVGSVQHQVFEDYRSYRSKFERDVREKLRSYGVTDTIAELLIAIGIEIAETPIKETTSIKRKPGFPHGFNAEQKALDPHIFSDDIRITHGSLFELAGEAVLLVGAIASVVTMGPAAIAGLVLFLHKYRRKSADIDGIAALILKTLRDESPREGMTCAELTAAMPLLTDAGINEGKVLESLQILAEVRLRSGQKTQFVIEQGNRWLAVDI